MVLCGTIRAQVFPFPDLPAFEFFVMITIWINQTITLHRSIVFRKSSIPTSVTDKEFSHFNHLCFLSNNSFSISATGHFFKFLNMHPLHRKSCLSEKQNLLRIESICSLILIILVICVFFQKIKTPCFHRVLVFLHSDYLHNSFQMRNTARMFKCHQIVFDKSEL